MTAVCNAFIFTRESSYAFSAF